MSESDSETENNTDFEFYRAGTLHSFYLRCRDNETLEINGCAVSDVYVGLRMVLLLCSSGEGTAKRDMYVIARNAERAKDLRLCLNVVSVLQPHYRLCEAACEDAKSVVDITEDAPNHLISALTNLLDRAEHHAAVLRLEVYIHPFTTEDAAQGAPSRKVAKLRKQMAIRGVEGLRIDDQGYLDLRFIRLDLHSEEIECDLSVDFIQNDKEGKETENQVLTVQKRTQGDNMQNSRRESSYTRVTVENCIFKREIMREIPSDTYIYGQLCEERRFYSFAEFGVGYEPKTEGFLSCPCSVRK